MHIFLGNIYMYTWSEKLWGFQATCNPHDNYVHVTGYPVLHGDLLHFLWGKHLQCKKIFWRAFLIERDHETIDWKSNNWAEAAQTQGSSNLLQIQNVYYKLIGTKKGPRKTWMDNEKAVWLYCPVEKKYTSSFSTTQDVQYNHEW